jgi:general secretion pathway protein J
VKPGRQPCLQRGFTLLEMLLAISLLVLLAGLAYGTLRIGVRGWETADAQADREDALRVGWPFLHQTLEDARVEVDPASNSLRFDGDSQQLSWVAELPAHFATGGPRTLTLRIVQDSQQARRQLQLSSRLLNAQSAGGEEPQQAVLVDDLASLNISYYGPNESGTANSWQASWRQRNSLPQLLRIDIAPSDAPPWPSLFAHPYLATPMAIEPEEPDDNTNQPAAED